MMISVKPRHEEKKESESGLSSYLRQIRTDSLLTAEEEKVLSRRIQDGDEWARERLIKSNLRLVVKIARGYLSSSMDLLDIIQEGNMGLIKAAEKYDFRKNVRFSTYASFWIRQSIARALSNESRMIRLPHRKDEGLRKVARASQRLSKKSGRVPGAEELSEETRMKVEDIEKILQLPDKVLSIESGEETFSFSLQNVLEDPKYNPDYIFMRNYLKEKTDEMLGILNEKERSVLLYRYAFIDGRKITLKNIGSKLSISPETVRQIEMRALRKIREHFTHLKDFLQD